MIFNLIIRNLRARGTRSLLTALGIGISIAIIIAIFALTNSLKSELGQAAQITEADLVAIQGGLGPEGSLIPESRIADIAGCEGVKRTTGFLLTTVSLSEIPSFNLFGVIPEDRDLYLSKGQLVEGRYIENSTEIVLGEIARDSLELKVGDTLELESGDNFTVVGICQTGNVYLDSGGIASLKEVQEIAGRKGKVTAIAVYLTPGADKETIAEQIESRWHNLRVMPSAYLLKTSVTWKRVETFAWVFSLIAIVMGCIGVINTMSMSVSERIREIGVLKAIGWGRFKVLQMILGESLILSLFGFGIGSLLGMGVVWIVTSLTIAKGFVSFSFTTNTFLTGLVVALILGFLGGAFSAYRALRLSPVEALRHE